LHRIIRQVLAMANCSRRRTNQQIVAHWFL
jgi:hypothetical protein